MALLRDLHFSAFDWKRAPHGDLARVEGLDSLRALIIRWLLTMPAADPDFLNVEERELRQRYRTAEARKAGYATPDGERLAGCLPWDPTWGAGIKAFLAAPMVPATLEAVRGRVRDGLARLEGVTAVKEVRVSSAVEGTMLVAWRVTTTLGELSDRTTVTA